MKKVQVFWRRSAQLRHPMTREMDEEGISAKRTVTGISVTDDHIRMVFETAADRDALERVLEATGNVTEYKIVAAGDEMNYVYMEEEARSLEASLQGVLDEYGLILVPPFEFTTDGIRMVVAGEQEDIQKALDALPDGLEVELEYLGEYSGGGMNDGQLTERQREAVAAAVDVGYYAVPREGGVQDVAERLGCAASTASDHLRRAEAKVMRARVQ